METATRLTIGKGLGPETNMEIWSLTMDAGLDLVITDMGGNDTDALRANETDAILVSLSTVPHDLPEEFAITALLPRKSAKIYLLLRDRDTDTSLDFRIKNNGFVFNQTKDDYVFDQLRVFRSDLQLTTDKKLASAILLPAAIAENAQMPDGTLLMPIDPSELTPKAGSGVNAIVCRRDDTATRTELKVLHHAATSQCTNVERAFERTFAEGAKNVAAHVYQSEQQYYAGHFCLTDTKGVLHRTTIMLSTFVGMADAAIEWGRKLMIKD
jgi:porphobilinogen deaminase